MGEKGFIVSRIVIEDLVNAFRLRARQLERTLAPHFNICWFYSRKKGSLSLSEAFTVGGFLQMWIQRGSSPLPTSGNAF